jgi:hypothetical protein
VEEETKQVQDADTAPSPASSPTKIPDVSVEDLKGTPADPEASIMVTVYNQTRKKLRRQLFKRKNLINKVALFVGVDEKAHVGVITAFTTDGQIVLYSKDGVSPDSKHEWRLVER